MNNLLLIQPNEGQRNWGNAINTNFKILYDKYRASLSVLQGLQNRFEELDTLKIQQYNYIYINEEQDAYICEFEGDGWLEPNTNIEFDPSSSDYISYQAWFVQTEDDQPVEYGDNNSKYIWNTGDLLIIHKQTSGINSLDSSYTTIEQWKNIMGGYFQPVSQDMKSNGELTTTYHKTPSLSTDNSVTLNTPHIYWKPTKFDMTDPQGNKLVFEPHKITNAGSSELLSGIPTISIYMANICWGTTVNMNKAAIPNDTIEFEIGQFWAGPNDQREINATAIFRDSSNNMLYFPYVVKRDGLTLIAEVSSGSYAGDIYAQFTITQDKTSEIRTIIEEIMQSINQE